MVHAQPGRYHRSAATRCWPPNAPANATRCCRPPKTCWPPVIAAVDAGRLTGKDQIGLKIGRLINKYKVAKHFDLAITDTTLTITNQARITAEAALDGIYVTRTSLPATILDPPGAVTAYKQLAHLERDFRSLKAIDLDLRPIHHHLEQRVRAHVLICMLAGYLVWHLRRSATSGWTGLAVTRPRVAGR